MAHEASQHLVDTQETVSKFKQNVKTAQSHMGEEPHLTRDVAKLNVKGSPLWAGRKTPVGQSDSQEDPAYAHQALPQHGFVIKEMPASFSERHPRPN